MIHIKNSLFKTSSMEILCPNCLTTYDVDQSLVFSDTQKKERSFKCSACDHVFVVLNPSYKQVYFPLEQLSSSSPSLSKDPGVPSKIPTKEQKEAYYKKHQIVPAKSFIAKTHLDWWLLGIAFCCVGVFFYSERDFLFDKEDANNPLVQLFEKQAENFVSQETF